MILQVLALSMAILLAVAALVEPRLVRRFVWIAAAQLLLYLLSTTFALSERLLIDTAFVAQAMVALVLLQLMRLATRANGAAIVVGETRGLAQDCPELAGLILVSALLLGWNPGCLLFVAEDQLLHQALHETGGLIMAAGIVLIPGILAIAAFQGYTSCFYGRRPQRLSGAAPSAPPLFWLRLGLTLTLLLGLAPGLWFAFFSD